MDIGAGPSHPARSSARTAQSASASGRLLPPPVAPPHGQGWVLVPVSPARTRNPKSEARVARLERQQTREREAAEQSMHHPRVMSAKPDEDVRLLAWVYRRSLMMADTDAQRFRQKNAEALRLAIEQSEREAKEVATEAARITKLKRGQDGAVRRRKGLVILCDSDDEDDDNCTSSSHDQDPPQAVDGYSWAAERKGKGPMRKW
ncbi:Phosphorylated carbohydrates phosphatase [Hordeum vulgare]|nr:Phosphorylated carbohydrates phosphatase [Hordeum vulgare]